MRKSEVFKPEKNLVLDHACDHLGIDVLKDLADKFRKRFRLDLNGVQSVDGNASVKVSLKVMGNKTGKRIGQRGFSCARVAGNADKLSVPDRHINIGKRHWRVFVCGLIAETEALHFDHFFSPYLYKTW